MFLRHVVTSSAFRSLKKCLFSFNATHATYATYATQ